MTVIDTRYNDDRMTLRQNAFLSLKQYNTLENVRNLYEFCHLWVSQGKTDTRGIEDSFLRYCENYSNP